MTVIEIDNDETWPEHLRAYVDHSREDLVAWALRESEIDELCQRCVSARWNPPQNEFVGGADEFVDVVNRLLAPHEFVARHCTRLTDAEIAEVTLTTGIEPLSTALTRRRLSALHEAGIIGDAELAALDAASLSEDSNRQGVTWWIVGRAPLRERVSVSRLFRRWGGEAIFWQHEGGELGQLLRTVGHAAIVEAVIPRSMLRTIGWTLGEAFRLAIANGELPVHEAVTDHAVPPVMIRRIVRFGTAEFEVLTGASTWGIDFTSSA